MADKKQRAIVLGATGNMAFALGSVFPGIKKHSPKLNADLIVFQEGISDKDKEILNSILPCAFIDYSFPENEQLKLAINRYSNLSFCRYEMFKMLDEYKKILWLDADILIQKDFSDIFNYARTGISLAPEDTKLRMCFSKPIENYDLTRKNYNSGVLLISDKLSNYQNITEWLYNKTFELADSLKFPDQGIINLLLQEFKPENDELPERYNCHPTKNNPKNAVIVHPYSPQKFWSWYNKAYQFKEWDDNYKQWLTMGGSPYTGITYDFWEKVVKNIDYDCPHPIRQPGKLLKFVLKRLKNA